MPFYFSNTFWVLTLGILNQRKRRKTTAITTKTTTGRNEKEHSSSSEASPTKSLLTNPRHSSSIAIVISTKSLPLVVFFYSFHLYFSKWLFFHYGNALWFSQSARIIPCRQKEGGSNWSRRLRQEDLGSECSFLFAEKESVLSWGIFPADEWTVGLGEFSFPFDLIL